MRPETFEDIKMTEGKDIADLLSSHGLKKTPIRIQILNLFLQHHYALSANDLVDHMKSGIDRVTVYRTLIAFEAQGILHKASENKHGIKYALCQHSSSYQEHADKHVHFVCESCNQTYCLSDVVIPEVQISAEFSVHKVNYTISGVCGACQTS